MGREGFDFGFDFTSSSIGRKEVACLIDCALAAFSLSLSLRFFGTSIIIVMSQSPPLISIPLACFRSLRGRRRSAGTGMSTD